MKRGFTVSIPDQRVCQANGAVVEKHVDTDTEDDTQNILATAAALAKARVYSKLFDLLLVI